MKTRASLKKRTPDCKIVRRKGRLFVINKKNPFACFLARNVIFKVIYFYLFN